MAIRYKPFAIRHSPLAQFAQFRQHVVIVRQGAGVVALDPADDALLVHDDDRAVGASQFVVEDAVLLRDLAVGPKVRDERI